MRDAPMPKRIPSSEQELNEKIEVCNRWLADGDTWLGGFENADLGHPEIGRRTLFPFSMSDGSFAKAEIGSTTAPDGRWIGLGWRYVLRIKSTDATAAARWLLRMEVDK